MMSQAGDALTMREVAENERPLLRTMFEAYSREIIPHSSVVQDPAYNARYFEARLARDVDSGQWWAAINETIVGLANVERGENEFGEAFARLLIQHMKERGTVQVAQRARLDSPAAVAFWRHLGFDPIQYIMIKELE